MKNINNLKPSYDEIYIILIIINNTILIINIIKMLHEICEKDSLIDYYYLTV